MWRIEVNWSQGIRECRAVRRWCKWRWWRQRRRRRRNKEKKYLKCVCIIFKLILSFPFTILRWLNYVGSFSLRNFGISYYDTSTPSSSLCHSTCMLWCCTYIIHIYVWAQHSRVQRHNSCAKCFSFRFHFISFQMQTNRRWTEHRETPRCECMPETFLFQFQSLCIHKYLSEGV